MRHLIVVDHDRCIGVLNERFAQACRELNWLPQSRQIRYVLSGEVAAVLDSVPIHDVARVRAQAFGC